MAVDGAAASSWVGIPSIPVQQPDNSQDTSQQPGTTGKSTDTGWDGSVSYFWRQISVDGKTAVLDTNWQQYQLLVWIVNWVSQSGVLVSHRITDLISLALLGIR